MIDSLEIFCDIKQHPYFGPKKTLKWMEEIYPESFYCYKRALQNLQMDCLEEWVVHIKNINEMMYKRARENIEQLEIKKVHIDEISRFSIRS